MRHVEYFHDHARIERLLFDGVRRAGRRQLRPDRARPGLGLAFKQADAQGFAITLMITLARLTAQDSTC